MPITFKQRKFVHALLDKKIAEWCFRNPNKTPFISIRLFDWKQEEPSKDEFKAQDVKVDGKIQPIVQLEQLVETTYQVTKKEKKKIQQTIKEVGNVTSSIHFPHHKEEVKIVSHVWEGSACVSISTESKSCSTQTEEQQDSSSVGGKIEQVKEAWKELCDDKEEPRLSQMCEMLSSSIDHIEEAYNSLDSLSISTPMLIDVVNESRTTIDVFKTLNKEHSQLMTTLMSKLLHALTKVFGHNRITMVVWIRYANSYINIEDGEIDPIVRSSSPKDLPPRLQYSVPEVTIDMFSILNKISPSPSSNLNFVSHHGKSVKMLLLNCKNPQIVFDQSVQLNQTTEDLIIHLLNSSNTVTLLLNEDYFTSKWCISELMISSILSSFGIRDVKCYTLMDQTTTVKKLSELHIRNLKVIPIRQNEIIDIL